MYLDDVFDLLVLIFILGISVLVGFGVVLPMTSDDYLKTNTVLEDKTAPEVGYETTVLEPGMSKLEVVLMTQVQEFGVPDPKKYKVGNTMIDITASYQESSNLTYAGVMAYNSLVGDKFEVVYNWNGTPTDRSDDFYEVRELVD